VLEARAR